MSDANEWDSLEARWGELFAASPTSSPPLRCLWLREWWRAYGEKYGARGTGLRLITLYEGPRLVGALPLYLSVTGGHFLGVRRMGFLSTGEEEAEETCPDYMDLLHEPGRAGDCLDAVAKWFRDRREPWDELELNDMASDSPLLALGTRLQETNLAAVVSPRGVCPIADLTGGFEAYLRRLSAKVRQHARQYVRGVEKSGMMFSVAGAEDVDEFFDDLVALHQARWTASGRPGCFSAPRFERFHRALARVWVPTGEAVIARLSAGSRPVGVLYGFVQNNKFDFYQSGIDLEAVEFVRSPGAAVQLLLMRHLVERGVRAFDFLRGSSKYKSTLATDERPLMGLRVVRRGVRHKVHQAARLARRTLNKSRAVFLGRPPQARPANAN